MASGNDDDDKGKDAETRGRKVPQGFEKILKRTRRGINHDKEKKDGEEEQSAGKTAAAEGDDKEASGEDRKEEENDDGIWLFFKNMWSLIRPEARDTILNLALQF